jgi:thermitase
MVHRSEGLLLKIVRIIMVGASLQFCMCADFPDSVKKLDELVTANIFFWPGRNPEVIPPDPENTGPTCSCGKKNESGSSMTQSIDTNVLEESDFPSHSTDAINNDLNKSVRYKKGEIIIKFKSGVSELKAKTAILKSGLATSDKGLFRKKTSIIRKVILNSSVTIEKAMVELKKNPDVEYVQPNYLYHVSTIPDDYEFASQWGLKNTGQTINRTVGIVGYDINAESAWDTTTECGGVVIAVLDTGVNYSHKDLSDNMWNGDACVDELGTPMGGCIHGYDFVENDKDPKDLFGHGTHVAGIIAAKGNDGNRISGVCWNAKIMAVRVLDVSGYGSTDNIVSGINFAIKNGAKILNASWGDYYYDQILYDAIEVAREHNVLFIASSGNSNLNNDLYPQYPASFDLANIISVGAMDQKGNLAYFSCYGTSSVDIAAPGTNILSDYPAQMVEANEYYSSWKREWGWEYEDYIDGQGNFKGSLNNYKIRNNMDSRAYGIYNLTINNPEIIILKFDLWRYSIQDGVNIVSMVYNTGGQYPNNNLFTLDNEHSNYAYNLTPLKTDTISLGFRFLTTSVLANEGIMIGPLIVSRWYHYNNATTCLYLNGTSMAAPFVTGVAGLVWSANTGLTYAQVKSKILNGAKFNSNLTGKIAGSRMLDAAGALSAAP